MEHDYVCRIQELETLIAELPSGSISKKKINGRIYYYHRWYESSKRKEKYIPADAVIDFQEKIQMRKEYEAERKELVKKMQEQQKTSQGQQTPKTLLFMDDTVEKNMRVLSDYVTNVRLGDRLEAFAKPVKDLKKREAYAGVHDYIYGKLQDKVLILYGLRRTGKTTLIRQVLADMDDECLEHAAVIQITAKNTLADVNHDLKLLEMRGYRYVFVDEVTLMEDFIEGAALFSDIFAASGMKLVLSGTDSLGFVFTEDEQLYDRCILVHTTFIPYREFESVLGIKGIDEYIRYGGTMSLGGMDYNHLSTFANKHRADEYVDSAIARNIQHSLKHYQYGGHFRHLQELYDQNELTSAINRVVEDINHRFTLEVLTRDFSSDDLAISAKNLRKDRMHPTDILDRIAISGVTDRLRHLLEIKNHMEQTVPLKEIHAAQIEEYLTVLDLVCKIDVASLPDVNRKSERTVIAQPGLRYAQADALIESLLLDDTFSQLSIMERDAVSERIRSEIRGRMMEDIVLLETKLAYPEKQVCVLQFAVGEFDMLIADPYSKTCRIFEIKHSAEIAPSQYRHLIDEGKCAATRHRYGDIIGKYVLYRGAAAEIDGISYQNVEDYLNHLPPKNKKQTMSYS